MLAYADDVVVVVIAKEEEVLDNMMKRFVKYLEENKLVLFVATSKLFIFGRKHTLPIEIWGTFPLTI